MVPLNFVPFCYFFTCAKIDIFLHFFVSNGLFYYFREVLSLFLGKTSFFLKFIKYPFESVV